MSKRSLKASPEGVRKAKQQFASRGLTQEHLANEIGIKTRQPIWRFFSGLPIERFTFFEICLNLDLDWRDIASNPPLEVLNQAEDKANIEFHHSISATPPKVDNGFRRFGFHGFNHQYCAQKSAQILNQELKDLRLITCHLGINCSLAAIRNGRSTDTTIIGFTPLEGLMMASHSRAIEPSILVYLMQKDGYTPDHLSLELPKESKNILGLSANLQLVLAEINMGNSRAKLALDIYIHRLRLSLASMAMKLGSVDGLVFTTGTGEDSAIVRELACQSLEFLGLKLDLDLNQNSPIDRDIAAKDSKVRVLVINTQEDWAIAKECLQQLQMEA
jgi:acetate kinase